MKILKIFIFLQALASFANAYSSPDWSARAPVPPEGRENIYELSPQELKTSVRLGRLHALNYPVEVTGSLLPFEPLNRWFKDLAPFTKWLGLHKYPGEEGESVFFVPFLEGKRPSYRMGFSLIETSHGKGFSFSCAACHSENLFGRPVMGLTNRFPRANRAFVQMKTAMKGFNPELFQLLTGATEGEVAMMQRTLRRLKSVEAREPMALGLDTSLAHVALSMSRRNPDEVASFSREYQKNPRVDVLRTQPADSKPAVWWNLKYKNRWLSDGSLISGNPLLTNILWNEIGRGTDLEELETWLRQNAHVVQELTAAVFATEAPRITDFISADEIDLRRAQRGESVFLKNCAGCHGVYEKNWSRPDAHRLAKEDLLRTVRVRYPSQTPVIDVGTDPLRWQGMSSLASHLNPLRISKQEGIVIQPQRGYVPPPLVGIWARWPYFHNNSAPSLCAVLTPAAQRPKTYWAGPARRIDRDFDFECNGYPLGADVPVQWKLQPEFFFDSRKAGLSNAGHDEGILRTQGREKMNAREKSDLVLFLQTL